MSICDSGMKNKVCGGILSISVDDQHPLVKLSNFIPWEALFQLVLPDLKTTTAGGKWWLGRKLKVRVHLAVYILQQMFNKTDRQIEYDIKDNAAYQIFCGVRVVDNWHCPDHTKIEEFRSRISAETQRRIANYMAVSASDAGFANFNNIDIDSTVQEANMTYPTQAKMLMKLGILAQKIADYVDNEVTDFTHRMKVHPFSVDLKAIRAQYRDFVFNSKKYDDVERKSKLKDLIQTLVPGVCAAKSVGRNILRWVRDIPWNIKRTIDQIVDVGEPYMSKLFSNLYMGACFKLPLSLHLNYVACFNKGKLHKNYEFGRAYQLVRLEGNIVMVLASTDVRMHDKYAVDKVIALHSEYFDDNNIESISADKGYYSSKNVSLLSEAGVKDIGLDRQHNIKSEHVCSPEVMKKMQDRRSGIEPIIGHLKSKGQMGRSRMKADHTTLASGYASVLGFNLRQIVRYQAGKMEKVA